MDEAKLRSLIAKYGAGKMSLDVLIREIKIEPFSNLEFACVDQHRSIRQSLPEVIFCNGKTSEQVIKIARSILENKNDLLATRASFSLYKSLKKAFPKAKYNKEAGAITVRIRPKKLKEGILVVSGGTSDISVAEEACLTAEMMGHKARRLYDVGVAGIHRLFKSTREILSANVLVAVAGMDGVLPSVVAGIVDVPVIAVPTSRGYGANFQGLAPLLTMLNSCAPGVSVVNIDNGFGAGYMAGLINNLAVKKPITTEAQRSLP